jgi:hypothetical protein
MVKSVLNAIPVHQLLVLAPPKKSLKAMEKIERGFLWAGLGVLPPMAATATSIGNVSVGPSPSEAWVSMTWSVPTSP